MKYTHKIAVSSDISSISKLMDLAIEGNMAKLLSEEQLEAAKESMGLDTQLIKDQTYFVVYAGQILVGCGGFSYRKTLFGGDHTPNRSDGLLDLSLIHI